MERFTAVFERDRDRWIGSVEELPGADTQGRPLSETRENRKDAIRFVIEANAREMTAGREGIREELRLAVA